KILGPRRKVAPGNCFTIGLEPSEDRYRQRAREARLAGATVVKVKVGGEGDARRLGVLNECWKGAMPLRLDANGGLTVEQARSLPDFEPVGVVADGETTVFRLREEAWAQCFGRGRRIDSAFVPSFDSASHPRPRSTASLSTSEPSGIPARTCGPIPPRTAWAM